MYEPCHPRGRRADQTKWIGPLAQTPGPLEPVAENCGQQPRCLCRRNIRLFLRLRFSTVPAADTFSFTLHSWGQSGLTPPARCVSTVGSYRWPRPPALWPLLSIGALSPPEDFFLIFSSFPSADRPPFTTAPLVSQYRLPPSWPHQPAL